MDSSELKGELPLGLAYIIKFILIYNLVRKDCLYRSVLTIMQLLFKKNDKIYASSIDLQITTNWDLVQNKKYPL
jgi:hypothetical protein